MDSVLVTGGTTFVSRAVAKHLIEAGYRVYILTRGRKPVDYSGFGEHLVCDRRDGEALRTVLAGRRYRFVFDICAYTGEDVRLMLTAIENAGIEKYLLCSSAAVYPPSDTPSDETAETGENPNWGRYGTDKAEAERALTQSGTPCVIFRPLYIYGEGNNLYREVYFFDRLTQGRPIPVPCGNGSRTQFVHIDDVVRLFREAMESPRFTGIYNLARPEEVTWEALVHACAEAAGIQETVRPVDVETSGVDPKLFFPFRDLIYQINTSKLERSGLRPPEIPLEEGLRHCFEWYLETKPVMSNPRMSQVDAVCET